MFIWRTDRIISAIEEYLPELSEKFSPIIPHLSTADERDAIEKYFPELPSISIDYGVMERDKDIALVEAEFTWSDLGCWDALDKIFKKDSSQNIVEGKSIEINSRNNIIVSEGIPIVCYGIEDMIVVSTEDAVLLIPRGKSQNVREIIDKLKEGEDWEKGIL
jgi:mannose-1-phosphate guanylyltransferase